MQYIFAVLLTVFSGCFFGIGYFITKKFKNKKQLSVLAVSMAFVVMIGIIFMDLLPEIFELINMTHFGQMQRILFVLIFSFLGFFLLKILDLFVPHHHHEHHEKEKNIIEHQEHLYHVGFITAFSLILHNILEGISIYILGMESLGAGFFMALAVGMHNLPLGIEIFNSLDAVKQNQSVKRLLLILLIVSGSIGAFGLSLFGNQIQQIVLVGLMCLSLGMILYLALFELLKEVYTYKDKKETFYGMVVGIVVLVLMSFIG